MCSLVHCDWDGYEKRLAEEQEEHDKKEEAQARGKVTTPSEDEAGMEGSWIVGPERELMPYAKIEKRLDDGCVSCGSNLTVGELERCIWVNNRQDILCAQCIEDFHQAAPYGSPN
jgi:hypothetical protein